MTRDRAIFDRRWLLLAVVLATAFASLHAAEPGASDAEAAASATTTSATTASMASSSAVAQEATAASTAASSAPEPSTAASGPVVAAVTQQPRAFGYLVGDVLTQRVLLEAQGRPVDPVALPPPARLGAWFERRGAKVETASDGRRWLVVDYQLINAPTAVATVRLASWDLAVNTLALRVPAWDVTIAPVVGAASAPLALQPDRTAPLRDVAGARRRLLVLSMALIACVLAWVGWIAWREARARRSQPFAQALHRLRQHTEADVAGPRRILHGAFDRTAAEVVRTSSLPRLFERAPHLAPLRSRIEHFYAQSEAYFFSGRPSAGAATAASENEATRAFCQDLRRLERAAER